MNELENDRRRLLESAAAQNKQTAADLEEMLKNQNIALADVEAIAAKQSELSSAFDDFLKEVKR